MLSHTKLGSRTGIIAGVLSALCLWLLGTLPAAAQVRPAREPIVTARLQRLVNMIPGSATDLPSYLSKPRDVYVLVTAGASYTDIQVLARSSVPPQTVAAALSAALANTSLRGEPVEWSADTYSAAQVREHHSHFGSVHGTNTVPIGPLMQGLRQAGLTPHLLLRVPHFVQMASLPPSFYGTRAFRWYDAFHVGSRPSVTVTAQVGWISLDRMLTFYVVIPFGGLLGLRLAAFLSERGSQDSFRRRRLFRSITLFSTVGAMLAQTGMFTYLLGTPTPAALADLWFGSSTTTVLVLFLIAGFLPVPLLFMFSRRQEIRRFGPLTTGPAIPMSDEEKAARKRIAQWSALPHLIGAVAVGAIPFFVSRTSPLYPFIHPVAMFLPAVGAALAGRIFQKRLAKFTQNTPDDGLTWRARELGQTLGVRMPDVVIEDSSRAAHLAFASHQGRHITLSRKLQETFTPPEVDFVMAHHLACMKRRSGGDKRWLKSLVLLPMLLPVFFILSTRSILGAPTLTMVVLSPWFFPGLLAYFGVFLTLTLVLAGGNTRRLTKQEANADRDALEVTGNLAAAEGALAKLEVNPAATVMLANSANTELARKVDALSTVRITTRRLELQKTAQTLRFAPATEAKTDTQITR